MSKSNNFEDKKSSRIERLEKFKNIFLGMKNIPAEIIEEKKAILKQQIRDPLKMGADIIYVKGILDSENKLKDLMPDFKEDEQLFRECLQVNLEFGFVNNLKFLRKNNEELFSEIVRGNLIHYGEIITNSFEFLHLPSNFEARSRYARNDSRSSTDKEAYLQEILPEYFVLYMAEKDTRNTYSAEVLEGFKKAIKYKDFVSCEYIAEKINFDIFDDSIKWRKLENPDIERKALEKYFHSAGRQKILENKQKILERALELGVESIVKKLAKDELIDLAKIKLSDEAKKNLAKMIEKNIITMASLSESNDNFQMNENIRLFSEHQAGEKFWQNLKNLFDNYPDSVIFKRIEDTPEIEYLKRVKNALSTQSPPIFGNREFKYLSTDFISFKQLFEAGLIDSDSIKKYMDKSQNSVTRFERSEEFVEYYEKIEFSDRVSYASQSGNLNLLKSLEKNNPQKYRQLKDKEPEIYDKNISEGVMKLLKSRDIEQIQAKIPNNSLKELGLTMEKLKELFEKPGNVLKLIVDKIIEICGLSSLRMKPYQKVIVSNLNNNISDIKVEEADIINKAEPGSTKKLNSSYREV